MNPFAKYLLLQLPGWLAAAVLLLWLWPRTGWSTGWAAALFTAWVAKDFALWPLLRTAYEKSPPTGAARLVGLRAVTRGELAPGGWVRVAGELWQARVAPGAAVIPAGTEVRIEAVEGRTLIVARDS